MPVEAARHGAGAPAAGAVGRRRPRGDRRRPAGRAGRDPSARRPADRLVAPRPAGPSGAVAADHVLGVSASTAALAGATIRRPIDGRLRPRDRVRRPGGACRRPQQPCRRLRRQPTCRRAGHADHRAQRPRPGLGPPRRPLRPGAGERFDLIVSNPPYVISPLRRYLFRDSGLPVDEVCRSIVRAAPAHLDVGGHCQLLASWAHVAGEDWRQRLETWFAGTGCDAYVLRARSARHRPPTRPAGCARPSRRARGGRTSMNGWRTARRTASRRSGSG